LNAGEERERLPEIIEEEADLEESISSEHGTMRNNIKC